MAVSCILHPLWAVVAQCLFPRFGLMAVVTHPAGILRGIVYSVV